MILLYHHVAPAAAVPDCPPPQDGWAFTLSAEQFDRHLEHFSRKGYAFITLEELGRHIGTHGREPRKCVTVTFDDGWLDNFTYALPVLKARGIPACFFVTTAELGETGGKKMSLSQLATLQREGMELGTHTRTHPNLTTLSPAEAFEEIAGSKQDLERALGAQVKYFAYPGGAFNRALSELVREAGYAGACSVLGPCVNTRESLFWLYRNTLSDGLGTLGDRYRLSPALTRVFSYRVRGRLAARLR